jgi:hypothetical protein
VVPSNEEYRGKALECMAAAEATVDPRERLALLEIAQSWMKLAKYVAARNGLPGDESQD